MRECLTIIGTFLTIYGFSQKDMTVDLHIAPLYSYRTINSTNPLWDEILLNKLDSIEKPNTGLSFGFSYEISIAKKFNIATGLDRTILGEKVTRNIIYFDVNLQPIEYSETLYNKYQYIGIPLQIAYNLISKSHWDIGFIGSLRLDILIQYDIERFSLRNDISLTTWTYNKLTLCSSAGIHFEYVIQRLSFFINPMYTRYLTSNAEYNYVDNSGHFNGEVNTEIKQHNYYLCASFGIKYKINNR